MANEDPTLDVQINVNANTQGAEQAKRAIREVGQEAEKSGQAAFRAATQHGSAFGRIVTGSRNLSAAMRGVTSVLQGGIFTLGGFAQALNALINVVRAAVVASGPWALLALAIGTVIGVLRGLMTHANKAARDLGGMGSAAAIAKRHVAEMAKQIHEDFEQIKKDADAVEKSFGYMNTRIAEATKRMEELNEAQHNLNLANLATAENQEVATAIAAGQTPDKIAAIRSRYATRRESAEESFKVAGITNQVRRAELEADNAHRAAIMMRGPKAAADLAFTEASGYRESQVGEARALMERFQRAEPGNIKDALFKQFQAALAGGKASVDLERKARDNATLIQRDFEQAQEHERQASYRAQTARDLAGVNIKTEGVTWQERQVQMRRDFESRRFDIETAGGERARLIGAEIASREAAMQGGFSSNTFSDPNYARMQQELAQLRRVAESIPNEIANAVNTLGDAYQKNLREMQKVKARIDSARSYTVGQ